MTQQNDFDVAVLAVIKGCNITASIKRLYEAGEIDNTELAALVGKFITLAEYNEILGIE